MIKKRILTIFLFCCSIFLYQTTKAAHLIGGELTYECLGGNNFKIRMTIYRDCNCTGCAQFFDAPAYIFIQDANGNPIDVFGQGHYIVANFNEIVDDTAVIPDFSDLCEGSEPNLCIRKGVYEEDVFFPPRADGYYLVYQRCCRNNTITNIVSPESTGATYVTHVYHPTNDCDNSSPYYNGFPPIVICNDYPLIFDHSATDPDGDSLYYHMCTPFDGANTNCPSIDPTDNGPCSNEPYPYDPIIWSFNYSEENQLGGNPFLDINPSTGLLSGHPVATGQYVVGVCVDEFRNGVMIGSTLRDFQFNVTDCDLVSASIGADAIQIDIGQYALLNCSSLTINFDNTSIGATDYFWDFGDPTNSNDTSTLENPTYTYPDTGKYTIQLIANPDKTCNDTAIIQLGIYPTFEADFLFDNQKCADEVFSFSDQSITTFGEINTWTWNFGDGTVLGPFTAASTPINTANTSGTAENPSHIYTNGGTYTVTLTCGNSIGCTADLSNTIEVYSEPNPLIQIQNACLDVGTVLSDISNVAGVNSWAWTLSDGNATYNTQTVTHTFSQAGNYTINLWTQTNHQCRDTTQQNITIYPEINIDLPSSIEICAGDQAELNAIVTGGSPTNTFHWEPVTMVQTPNNDSTTTISLTATQTFILYANDVNHCEKTAEIEVIVHPLPETVLPEEIKVCFEESTQLSFSPTPDIAAWQWQELGNNQAIFAPNENNITITPFDTIYYVLETQNIYQCLDYDTLQVSVIPPFSILSVSEPQSICPGDSAVMTASGALSYTWMPSNSLNNDSSAQVLASPSENTTYTVIFENEGCFFDTLSTSIDLYPLPYVDAGADVTYNVGESAVLNGTGENGYFWSPDTALSDSNIPNPTTNALVSTTYFLTTYSDHNCAATDAVHVEVTNYFDIWIPQAFSPNGDGLNDKIRFFSRGIADVLEFKIFNRWGEMVYSGNDLNDGWDGIYKGFPAPLGVYVYYIRAEKYLGGIYEKQGNITLIR